MKPFTKLLKKFQKPKIIKEMRSLKKYFKTKFAHAPFGEPEGVVL